MAKTQYLQCIIYLTDPDLVDQYQQNPPGERHWVGGGDPQYAIIRAPYGPGPPPGGAAVEFAAPLQEVDEPFVAPCLRSNWFTPDNDFPRDVATFTRGGFWSKIFGTSTRFYWHHFFMYAPPPDPVPNPGVDRDLIPQRRWVDGFFAFEASSQGTEVTPSLFTSMTRGAARTVDGIGFAQRGLANIRNRRLTDYTGGGTSTEHQSWERLYIRLQKAPASSTPWWRSHATVSPNAGIRLDITPDGRIAISNVDNVGTATLLGTTDALTIGAWVKVDLLLRYNNAASGGDGGFSVYLNGQQAFSVTVPSASGGIGQAQTYHASTDLGSATGAGNRLELDVAFWMNAAPPPNLNSIDWLNGSRAVLVRPSGFAAGHGTWAGDWRLLETNPTQYAEDLLSSSTTDDPLLVTTDAATALAALPGTMGVVAFVVHLYGTKGTAGGAGDGQLGYKIGADAPVLATVAQGITNLNWNSVMYRPAGLDVPVPLDTLELHHVRASHSQQSKVQQLMATAEVIGVWGPEDLQPGLPATPATPRFSGIHNSPYPRSPWAQSETPPFSPVMIFGGTYVGTGTFQDLSFTVPIHFLWIRRVGGTENRTVWWSSRLAAGQDTHKRPFADLQVERLIDPDFVGTGNDVGARSLVRVTGDHNASNATGVTYAYVAFGDPGMRFMLAEAFAHYNTVLPASYQMIDPAFTPEAGFVLDERAGTDAAARLMFKGLGNAVASATLISSGAQQNTALQFAAGTLLADSGLFSGVDLFATLALWRRADGNNDPGQANVLGLATYVGNGGTRTISFTPPATKYPLWALVVPFNAQAWFKDHAHTGGNATSIGGAQATGYITSGAINQITVGANLNASGITYDVLVFWGGDTGGVDGFSLPGEFMPVEPTSPIGGPNGPYGPEPGEIEEPGGEEPGEPNPGGGGGPDDINTELATSCVPFTQRIVNLALTRIGVSTRITDLATEDTQHADMARMVLSGAIQTTLRDFPWPFATKYVTLTLVTGSLTTPANADWRYAYRRPADCIFERRIVVDREGAVDPKGPPLRLGHDATGDLIFTNEANAVLEYTARPDCSPGLGDPLFRDALAWRLAADLAPALTRVADKAVHAQQEYDKAIAKAVQVIQLGNPGLRVPATADPDAACQSTKRALVNRAFLRIGVQSVAHLDDEQSREVEAVTAIYEEELQAVLRDHPWAFATQYAESLALVRGPAGAGWTVQTWSASQPYVPGDVVDLAGTVYACRLGHTNQSPPNATYWSTEPAPAANADWTYAYRVPADAVLVRRIATPGVGRRHDPAPLRFRIGQDATGRLLLTDQPQPIIEYTARLACVIGLGDAIFRDALAWRLAACLAPSLAQVDPMIVEQRGRGPEFQPPEREAFRAQLRQRVAEKAWAMYRQVLATAGRGDANEQQPTRHGDADWILGRE